MKFLQNSFLTNYFFLWDWNQTRQKGVGLNKEDSVAPKAPKIIFLATLQHLLGISLFFGHFRSMSQKLQVDVGKVNEEKTLLSAIVKNTQGIISKSKRVILQCRAK